MLGFSVYLNQPISADIRHEMELMAQAGFEGVFTSIHIPEENPLHYRQLLGELGEVTQALGLKLMVDISRQSLERAGFSLEHMEELTALGVTGLRMDEFSSYQRIATLSHELTIALNASTLTEQDLKALIREQADFDHLEAWHNFYPRPETGLDAAWFHEKNEWLRAYGMTVQGFVAGDERLRGPLQQGLPTLEQHRDQHPLAAAIELFETVDKVYIGDPHLSQAARNQFAAYFVEHQVILRVEEISEQITRVLGNHTNRQDAARDVIRSAEARMQAVTHVPPLTARAREVGAVTIDNERYLRYMGEIQVVKRALPADEKVNVVGRVCEEDRALMKHIQAGQAFRLVKKEEDTYDKH